MLVFSSKSLINRPKKLPRLFYRTSYAIWRFAISLIWRSWYLQLCPQWEDVRKNNTTLFVRFFTSFFSSVGECHSCPSIYLHRFVWCGMRMHPIYCSRSSESNVSWPIMSTARSPEILSFWPYTSQCFKLNCGHLFSAAPSFFATFLVLWRRHAC